MIRLRRQSKPVLLENKSSWSKDAKKVWIGGDHPIVVQSMTTTDTADYEKTLEQVYALAMVAVIVGVDVLFFRNRFWERLAVNIGIVLVFGAFYFRFFRHP